MALREPLKFVNSVGVLVVLFILIFVYIEKSLSIYGHYIIHEVQKSGRYINFQTIEAFIITKYSS